MVIEKPMKTLKVIDRKSPLECICTKKFPRGITVIVHIKIDNAINSPKKNKRQSSSFNTDSPVEKITIYWDINRPWNQLYVEKEMPNTSEVDRILAALDVLYKQVTKPSKLANVRNVGIRTNSLYLHKMTVIPPPPTKEDFRSQITERETNDAKIWSADDFEKLFISYKKLYSKKQICGSPDSRYFQKMILLPQVELGNAVVAFTDGGCWPQTKEQFSYKKYASMKVSQNPSNDNEDKYEKSNAAEHIAMKVLLRMAHSLRLQSLVVFSDSDQTISNITTKYYTLVENGWLNSDKSPFKDKDHLKECAKLWTIRQLNATYEHVYSHEGQAENEACDQLTKREYSKFKKNISYPDNEVTMRHRDGNCTICHLSNNELKNILNLQMGMGSASFPSKKQEIHEPMGVTVSGFFKKKHTMAWQSCYEIKWKSNKIVDMSKYNTVSSIPSDLGYDYEYCCLVALTLVLIQARSHGLKNLEIDINHPRISAHIDFIMATEKKNKKRDEVLKSTRYVREYKAIVFLLDREGLECTWNVQPAFISSLPTFNRIEENTMLRNLQVTTDSSSAVIQSFTATPSYVHAIISWIRDVIDQLKVNEQVLKLLNKTDIENNIALLRESPAWKDLCNYFFVDKFKKKSRNFGTFVLVPHDIRPNDPTAVQGMGCEIHFTARIHTTCNRETTPLLFCLCGKCQYVPKSNIVCCEELPRPDGFVVGLQCIIDSGIVQFCLNKTVVTSHIRYHLFLLDDAATVKPLTNSDLYDTAIRIFTASVHTTMPMCVKSAFGKIYPVTVDDESETDASDGHTSGTEKSEAVTEASEAMTSAQTRNEMEITLLPSSENEEFESEYGDDTIVDDEADESLLEETTTSSLVYVRVLVSFNKETSKSAYRIEWNPSDQVINHELLENWHDYEYTCLVALIEVLKKAEPGANLEISVNHPRVVSYIQLLTDKVQPLQYIKSKKFDRYSEKYKEIFSLLKKPKTTGLKIPIGHSSSNLKHLVNGIKVNSDGAGYFSNLPAASPAYDFCVLKSIIKELELLLLPRNKLKDYIPTLVFLLEGPLATALAEKVNIWLESEHMRENLNVQLEKEDIVSSWRYNPIWQYLCQLYFVDDEEKKERMFGTFVVIANDAFPSDSSIVGNVNLQAAANQIDSSVHFRIKINTESDRKENPKLFCFCNMCGKLPDEVTANDDASQQARLCCREPTSYNGSLTSVIGSDTQHYCIADWEIVQLCLDKEFVVSHLKTENRIPVSVSNKVLRDTALLLYTINVKAEQNANGLHSTDDLIVPLCVLSAIYEKYPIDLTP